MDKIEQFIKKNKGCPLTPAATKQLLDKFMEFMGKELPGMISEEGGLKYGYYYFLYNPDRIVYGGVEGELIPEDYNGVCFEFLDDAFYIARYVDGEEVAYVMIGGDHINIWNEDNQGWNITVNGVEKLNFARLTHSFNELDPTLKAIIDNTISTQEPVPCTQAQWNVIKALLDKALYINYNGFSMIKATSDNIQNYYFGSLGALVGASLDITYDDVNNTLNVEYNDI